MSYPNLPNFPPSLPPAGTSGPADPGYIPLRPLSVGDLFGVGLGVVRRHLALLAPVAIVIAALASAAELAILSGTGTLGTVASGAWVNDLFDALSKGRTAAVPAGLYASVGAGTLVSLGGALLLSSVVVACVAADAVSRRPPPGAIADRLRGRVGAAAAASLLVTIAIMAGSFVLIVPGVLAYVVWAAAAPIAVMERSGPAAALARSARLTRGHRWRILGVTLLITLVTVAIEEVISSVAVALVPSLSAVAALIVGEAVAALVAAVTMPWLGAVIALLYVDIRLRTEHLGDALRAAAQRPLPPI